ncbi:MAG: hypothetical protein LBN38_00625 [Verrucomicrobiota bacterium]|nr:hypothetical protein [Verrucomicrobiota bacterium]
MEWKTFFHVGAAVLLSLAGGCSEAPSDALVLPEGQSAFIQAGQSTNRIRIGDPVDVQIRVLHQADSRVSFPSVAKGKDLLVRHTTEQTSEQADGLLLTVQDMTLTSLCVSNHIIGEDASILISTPEGVQTHTYPFLSLEVVSSLSPGETDPRPVRANLAYWPAPSTRWMWAIPAGLALLAALLFGLWKFLKKPRSHLQVAPSIPPHEEALAALEALRAKGWIEQLNIGPFYVELSGIVRRYVEDRFQLRAPERTTEEFIHEAMQGGVLAPGQRERLAAFLAQSDLVKFARHAPGRLDMTRALDTAVSFVRETIPATAPAPEEGRTA